MATITVELNEELLAFVESEVARLNFADVGCYLRAVLESAAEIELISFKLQAAEDSIARGDFSEWKPGDGAKQFEELVKRHKIGIE